MAFFSRPPADTALFPLQTVLFPGGRLALRVFEPRYVDMVADCLKQGEPFGVCRIVEGEEVGPPATPEAIGCLAEIVDWNMAQPGILQLDIRGGARFQAETPRIGSDGLTRAQIQPLPEEPPLPLPPEAAACAVVLRQIIDRVGADHFHPPFDFDDAVWVGFRLAEALPLRLQARQRLLEITDTLTRLKVLQLFLQQQGLLSR